jgi:hypothetical protein
MIRISTGLREYPSPQPPHRLWRPPATYAMATRVLSQIEKLPWHETDHLHLVPRLIFGSVSLFPHTYSWHGVRLDITGATLP